MSGFLITLARISVFMSAVILILLAASRIWKNKFTARCAFILWAVVILRLICVVTVPGVFNVEVTVPSFMSGSAVQSVAPSGEAILPDQQAGQAASDAAAPDASGNKQSGGQSTGNAALPLQDGSAQSGIYQEQTQRTSANVLPYVLFLVWIAGALAFAAFNAGAYFSAKAKISRTLREPDDEEKRIFEEALGLAGLRRAPRFAVCTGNAGPLLYGFFRPTLIIPDMELTPEEKTAVLLHELTHYRRHHLWFKLAGVAARSIHWFNPLVHVAAYRMDRAMELSCDEELLRGRSGEERSVYGNTIIHIIRENAAGPIGLTTSFDPDKKTVKERLENVMNTSRKRAGRALIAVLLAVSLAVGIVGFTACETEPEKPDDTSSDTGNVQTEPAKTEYGTKYVKDTEDTPSIVTELSALDFVESVEKLEPLTGGLFAVESYDIVISVEDVGTLEMLLSVPNDHDVKQYPAIMWGSDAAISANRFANVSQYGYAVFAIYYRGYVDRQNDNTPSKSTGTYGMGSPSDIKDLESVVELIKSCSFVEPDRIFAVAGQHMNFTFAMQRYVIEKQGGGIRALALTNPVTDMYYFLGLEEGGDVPEEDYDAYKEIFGGSPAEVPEEYDARSSIKNVDKINIPLLVAYFDNSDYDTVFDREQSVGFVEALQNAGKDVTVVEFDFAGTDFYVAESMNYLRDWFHGFR